MKYSPNNVDFTIAMETIDLEAAECHPCDVAVTNNKENSNRRPLEPLQQPAKSSSFHKHDRGQTLRWSNVNMNLIEAGKRPRDNPTIKKQILQGVWGEARPGETTAIMGASGAGKTSLFNVLSGHHEHTPNIVISGDISLGNTRITSKNRAAIQKTFAYVGQFDTLHEQSTPREAIRFSAKLRLDRSTSDEEIEELVTTYIEQLGLTKCADSLIGGELVQGISGGERRRTSVGVELVTNPTTIYLDEPTSGLDSFAAATVLTLLDQLAAAGNTVLFTIHQPSSRLFTAFDKLILIHAGRLMHVGDTSLIPQDFGACGYPVPDNTNPADWILEVAQENTVEMLEKAGFFPEDTRPPMELGNENVQVCSELVKSHERPTLGTQIKLLLGRECMALQRYPSSFTFSFSVVLIVSIFSGVLFFKIGAQDRNQTGVLAGILGAVTQTMIYTMIMSGNMVIGSVVHEKRLFVKEATTDHYAALPRLVSKFVIESLQTLIITFCATIVTYFMAGMTQRYGVLFGANMLLALNANALATIFGAMIKDPKLAPSLLGAVYIPQMFFSGMMIAPPLMPTWISWAQYVCVLRYTTGLVLLYEFANCGDASDTCKAYLETYGLNQEQVNLFWGMSIALLVICQLGAYYFMRRSIKPAA